MRTSPALENFVRTWTLKLEHVYPRISRCNVVIERPHQHKRHGQRVHVRVSLSVPGCDAIVSGDHSLDGAHEDAYVAIRDAFRAARRQLDERVRRRRHDAKRKRGGRGASRASTSRSAIGAALAG